MFIVIYTGIWLGVTILVGAVGFMLGKLQIVDASPLPWVMHRDYVPCSPPGTEIPGQPDLNRDRTF